MWFCNKKGVYQERRVSFRYLLIERALEVGAITHLHSVAFTSALLQRTIRRRRHA